jgi:calcineurin-like phosphoesterase family protein
VEIGNPSNSRELQMTVRIPVRIAARSKPQLWLITDTHFHHKAMVEYCGRPDDHTDVICANWRKLVAPHDTVIHLGDVIFNQAGSVGEILSSLPGTKILILGNHDYHHKEGWWMEKGFALICRSLVVRNALLTHLPAAELPANATINIHGHFHNSDHHRWDCPTYPHNKLLHIEDTLAPILFDEIAPERKGALVLA